jgi:D-lactate dehydrogenase
MKTAVFSTKSHDRSFLEAANKDHRHEFVFFEDLSDKVIQDDVFACLLTFPNVVITGHQAFFTKNALQKIAETTVSNITEFERQGSCGNEVSIESVTG